MPTRSTAKARSTAKKTVKKKAPAPAQAPLFTDADIQEYVRRASERVTVEDLATVVKKARAISGAFSANSPLGKMKVDAELMLSLCVDYWKGRYRKMPFWSLAPVIVALSYVIKPVDIIPDFIPGIGQQDDLMIAKECLRLCGDDLAHYRRWKRSQA